MLMILASLLSECFGNGRRAKQAGAHDACQSAPLMLTILALPLRMAKGRSRLMLVMLASWLS